MLAGDGPLAHVAKTSAKNLTKPPICAQKYDTGNVLKNITY